MFSTLCFLFKNTSNVHTNLGRKEQKTTTMVKVVQEV